MTSQTCCVHEKSSVHGTVNTALSMNNTQIGPLRLEADCAEALRALLSSVRWLNFEILMSESISDSGFDLNATVCSTEGRSASVLVQCTSQPRPSRFPSRSVNEGRLSSKGPKVVVRVLAAPYVSPRLAEICRREGWSWYDLAGNCWLDIPGVLRIERSGNKLIRVQGNREVNLGSTEASSIVRVLLAPENAAKWWTHRGLVNHISDTTGIASAPSLGLVNKVIKYLREQAFLETSNKGEKLLEPSALLALWRTAYRFDRHVRAGCFTLLKGARLADALAKIAEDVGGKISYASFSAADREAPHVRQPKSWFYADGVNIADLREVVKPVDTGENVVLITPNDSGVFYGPDQCGPLPCTNVVQTYVDLWHSGGRGHEAAEALKEQRLIPIWSQHGMR